MGVCKRILIACMSVYSPIEDPVVFYKLLTYLSLSGMHTRSSLNKAKQWTFWPCCISKNEYFIAMYFMLQFHWDESQSLSEPHASSSLSFGCGTGDYNLPCSTVIFPDFSAETIANKPKIFQSVSDKEKYKFGESGYRSRYLSHAKRALYHLS